MTHTAEVDWKFVAHERQCKLNLIAGELNSWKKNCASADCAFMAADIIQKFHLDSDSLGIPSPDYVELRKRLDAISGLVARLRFAPIHSREAMVEELSGLLADFGLNFSFFGAVNCL